MNKFNVLGIIPARYNSSRFPGKVIALLNGIPLIKIIYESCSQSKYLDHVIVATDDRRVSDICHTENIPFIRTSDQHISGTDRLIEVADRLDANVYVNIQGDEPFISSSDIDACVTPIVENRQSVINTLATIIPQGSKVDNPNCVKVVFDKNQRALYFSRLPIPFDRDNLCQTTYYQHIGIYAFTKKAIDSIRNLSVSEMERSEKLEQLRWLEAAIPIHVSCIQKADHIGIDTPEDLELAKTLVGKHANLSCNPF